MNNRIINSIGVYLFVWLLFLILFPIYIYQSGLDDIFLKSLIYIASAGGLGGIIYLIRSFYLHIFEKDFRSDSFWWYVFRPFTSIIIGIISYFLIVGGLLSLGVVSEVDYQKSILFYCGISFLAGFSFTQFSNKLEELARTLFSKSEVNKK